MDSKQMIYPIRYRGHLKGDTPLGGTPNKGGIEYWTLAQILEEINRDRSAHWTDYDETDWREGLDEWTEWEPVDLEDMTPEDMDIYERAMFNSKVPYEKRREIVRSWEEIWGVPLREEEIDI